MDNINDIIASLSPEDIEALKETAESIFGSDGIGSGGSGENGRSQAPPSSGRQGHGFDFGSLLDPAMFAKLSQIISAMNSDGGKRCRLIEALKPNLSEPRQRKADEAMQIIKLMDVLPMITTLINRDDK